MNGYALFPDAVIMKAEGKIAQFETNKHTSQPSPGHGGDIRDSKTGINPILLVAKRTKTLPIPLPEPKQKCQPGNLFVDVIDPVRKAVDVRPAIVPHMPRIPLSINDNHSISSLGQIARSGNLGVKSVRDKDISVLVPVNGCCPVASPVLSVTNTTRQSQRQSQKKR